MTIREHARAGSVFLRGASTSPELDSELLLASLLKKDRPYLLAHGEDLVTPRTADRFTALVKRRRTGEPLPYLTGSKEFYGRPFAVDRNVLIPRPESETIVDEVLRIAERNTDSRVIADVGTGSGCLAITLALELPKSRIVALDTSPSALAVARKNARTHRVLRRIAFFESDLLNNIPEELHPHIIVANVPYVASDDLKHAAGHPDTKGLTFEPPRALNGGPDGLHVIRRLFGQLKREQVLPRNFQALILEHGRAQQRPVLRLAYDSLPGYVPTAVTPFVTVIERRGI